MSTARQDLESALSTMGVNLALLGSVLSGGATESVSVPTLADSSMSQSIPSRARSIATLNTRTDKVNRNLSNITGVTNNRLNVFSRQYARVGGPNTPDSTLPPGWVRQSGTILGPPDASGNATPWLATTNQFGSSTNARKMGFVLLSIGTAGTSVGGTLWRVYSDGSTWTQVDRIDGIAPGNHIIGTLWSANGTANSDRIATQTGGTHLRVENQSTATALYVYTVTVIEV